MRRYLHGDTSGRFFGLLDGADVTRVFGSAQLTASLIGSTQAFTLSLKASTQIQVTGLTCSPTTFNTGSSSVCKVMLNGAPGANVAIALSSDTANVHVPSSITISSGQTSAQFNVTSTLVDADKTATLSATLGGGSRTIALTLIGVRPSSLSCSPLALSAGGSTRCTVHLNRAAQTSQLTLLVSSSSASLQVPQSITLRSWQTQYSFTARAGTFAPPGPVEITAAYLASAVSAGITILAPSAPTLMAPSSLTTTAGNPLQITAQAQDLRGLNVNLTANGLPDGASFTVAPPAATGFAATPPAASSPAAISTAADGTSGVMAWTPTLAQIGVYSVRLNASSSAGATGQTVTIRVASPVPQIGAVLNAASLSASQVCVAGSLAVVEGSALIAPSNNAAWGIAKTELTVNGDSVDIILASETELAFRCPENASGSVLRVQVATSFGVSNTFRVKGLDAAPGIFTLDGSGTGQGLVFLSGTGDVAALTDPGFPSQPAVPGDTLSLVVTGLPDMFAEHAAPSLVQVTIGHFAAEVLSLAGIDEYPGVKMLAVRVPRHAPVGDSIPVQVFSQRQEAESNTVTIAIAPAAE